jgi:hypothetical protein
MPKEEMLEVAKTNQQLFIGLPAECTLQENRVALVPEAVARLVHNGHEVVVETNAGKVRITKTKTSARLERALFIPAKRCIKPK